MAQTKKFSVIATEPTPNSAAFKFVVNNVIIKDGGSRAFNNAEEAESDPFAKEIFDFGVVDFLYIKERFVSITLISPDEWDDMFDPFIQTIEEHLVPYEDAGAVPQKSILDDVDLDKFMDYDDDTKREIIDAFMDEGVRPALAQDGGGILVKDVDGDVVSVQYQGACGSCSKSESSTLSAMQNILQKSIHPELKVVIRGFGDI